LQATLAATPTENTMTRAPVAEDILVLEHAARDDEVRAVTRTRADVERLWEVCQVPDYRKIAPATHAELVVTLYGFLMREGAIPTDWFARQIEQADRTDGDIDTLSTRIAHIRTWTFAANRPDWLADPEHWQNVTRGVEDKLSDALHERLTERFVDRRTSVLMRRLRENALLEPEINKTGDVLVEGHAIGRLDGLVFVADASSGGSEAKALQNAAQKALAGELATRAARLAEAPDEQFVLATDGTVRWTGAAVGKLIAGEEALRPRVRVVADEHLAGAPRDAVEARLDRWVKSHIEKLLGPLFELAAAADVSGIARGVAFQLVEALGVLDRQRVAEEVKGLEQPERASLRKYGVRFGAYHIYLPVLLKPAPRALAVQLWALAHDGLQSKGLEDLLHLAGSGRTSIPVNREIDAALYRTTGYRACGERAVRVDILERLADLIRPALAWREGALGAKPPGAVAGGGFTVVNAMTSLTGASGEGFASILRSLGYCMEQRPKPAEPAPAITAPGLPGEVAGLAGSGEEAAALPEPPEGASHPVNGETGPDAVAAPDIVSDVPLAPVDAQEPYVETATTQEGPKIVDPQSASNESLDAAGPAITGPHHGEEVGGCNGPGEGAPPTPESAASPADSGPLPANAESEIAAAAATTPPEPIFIEVWRPGRQGRPEGRRRPRGRHREAGKSWAKGPDAQTQDAAAAVSTEAAAAELTAAEPAKPERHTRHRRRHGPDQRFERPRRERERAPVHVARHERHERREKAPDPNSPFAKLAALKVQLEEEAKERR
jgi:ATP-dependent RNA helicase SUPV3L1/SUV3